jgi:hypothetical protein
MIVRENGWLCVDFDDWTGAMMALCFALSKLPVHPDTPDLMENSYPLGIERLRASGGDEAVEALYEVVRELEFRPISDPVEALGEAAMGARKGLRRVARDVRFHRRV